MNPNIPDTEGTESNALNIYVQGSLSPMLCLDLSSIIILLLWLLSTLQVHRLILRV